MALILTRYPDQGFRLLNVYDKDGNKLPDIQITRIDEERLMIEADSSVTILRDEVPERQL